MKAGPLALLLVTAVPLAAQTPAPRVNPFFAPSPLPFQAPPFDRITDADYQPAIEGGIDQQRAEIARIAENPAPPTFANTIEAMERSGELLSRAMAVFSSIMSAHTNPALQLVERDVAPKLAAHGDEIYLNAKLFARVRAIYDTRASLKLSPEARAVVELYYRDFVRSGALLNDADKASLKALNQEESSLVTEYRRLRLAANNAAAVIVDDRAQLDGLSEADISAAAQAARAQKLEGKWVLTLQNTTPQPALASLKNRDLRKRLHEASMARGGAGDPNTSVPTIARLAQIRARKAALLGYPTFAAYALDDQMAKTPGTALKLLTDVTAASVARARDEAARMQRLIDQEGGGVPLAAWDWEYYAERVRKADFDFDEEEVRPYFELDRVLRDGVFFAATRLYGITFSERRDLPVYHPDVRVFEVRDTDGRPLGLFYADLFARPTKGGGAWMNSFVRQSKLLETRAVVTTTSTSRSPRPVSPCC